MTTTEPVAYTYEADIHGRGARVWRGCVLMRRLWPVAGVLATVWLVGFLCLAGSGYDAPTAALWPVHAIGRLLNVGSSGSPFVRNVDM